MLRIEGTGPHTLHEAAALTTLHECRFTPAKPYSQACRQSRRTTERFNGAKANRAGRSAHRGALLVTSGYRGRLGPDSGLTGDVGADPVVAGAAALAGGW